MAVSTAVHACMIEGGLFSGGELQSRFAERRPQLDHQAELLPMDHAVPGSAVARVKCGPHATSSLTS